MRPPSVVDDWWEVRQGLVAMSPGMVFGEHTRESGHSWCHRVIAGGLRFDEDRKLCVAAVGGRPGDVAGAPRESGIDMLGERRLQALVVDAF
ncbi:MAG: hypothetical protein OXE81_03315 [Gammaproteobacteria bacterium]|nr:hypothetical protein [Gammaproteobacteria bacterium]